MLYNKNSISTVLLILLVGISTFGSIGVFVTSFVIPSTPPKQQHRWKTIERAGWFGGGDDEKTKKEKVTFIPISDSNDDNKNEDTNKAPTDVVATRMTRDEDTTTSKEEEVILDVSSSRSDGYDGPETDCDVIVVGGGCAGIGMALMLTRTFGLDNDRVLVVEQAAEVGESFRRWPKEMKFISPSFNQQGWTNSFDLNAIHYDTSPAFLLRTEHPSGDDYAIYLEAIAQQAQLNIRLNTKVTSITPHSNNDNNDDDKSYQGPFHVELTSQNDSNNNKKETLSTRYVVWAAGEFQYPNETPKEKKKSSDDDKDEEEEEDGLFPGAELCLHNSRIDSYAELPGDQFVVIGGYESGVDAAYNLAKAGKKCKVLASTPCWSIKTGDPSTELAPYTASRLRDVLAYDFSPKPRLMSPIRVIAVEKAKDDDNNDCYHVAAKWKAVEDDQSIDAIGIDMKPPGTAESVIVVTTPQPPILCTGFEGSVAAQARHLFDFPNAEQKKKGCIGNGPLLSRNDESTKVPGIFLAGPSVTHGELSFCFVYKFRQRFAVVANAICQDGLGHNTEQAVAECRRTNMYLDDFFSCESDTCGDTC